MDGDGMGSLCGMVAWGNDYHAVVGRSMALVDVFRHDFPAYDSHHNQLHLFVGHARLNNACRDKGKAKQGNKDQSRKQGLAKGK